MGNYYEYYTTEQVDQGAKNKQELGSGVDLESLNDFFNTLAALMFSTKAIYPIFNIRYRIYVHILYMYIN